MGDDKMSYNLKVKMTNGTELDVTQFDGFCEERDNAGRHFRGYCVWEYDLTEEKDVVPECRGIYYLSGFADGDWGTEFDAHEFISNEKLVAQKIAAGYNVKYSFPNEKVAKQFQEFLCGAAEQEWEMWKGLEDLSASYDYKTGDVKFTINEE